MAKLTALIIAAAVATAGLSQAALAQSTMPSQDEGALLGASITADTSQGSGDVNSGASGNGLNANIAAPDTNQANEPAAGNGMDVTSGQ
jgi:hypothetical protein